MKVRVKFVGMPELLSVFKDQKEIQINFNGDTVGDLLHHLSSKIRPKRMDIFFNDQGEIFPDLLVLINGRLISDSN